MMSSVEQPVAPRCFVCQEDASGADADPADADVPLCTETTQTAVAELLESFLGYDLRPVRSATDRWCSVCLGRINRYDLLMQAARDVRDQIVEVFQAACKPANGDDIEIEMLDEQSMSSTQLDDDEQRIETESQPDNGESLSEQAFGESLPALQTDDSDVETVYMLDTASDAADVRSNDEAVQRLYDDDADEENDTAVYLLDEDTVNTDDLFVERLSDSCSLLDECATGRTSAVRESPPVASPDTQRVLRKRKAPQATPKPRVRGKYQPPELMITPDTKFSCERCAQMFDSNEAFKSHVNACKLSKEAFRCTQCPDEFRTRIGLKIHQQSEHNGIKPLACEHCGRQFATQPALERHIPIHTGERPYQCDECGKQFCHYSSFKMHIRAHHNVRDKQCTICGIELRSTSHLTRHMRVHSGEKPYKCPACGQRFGQRYNMMTHYKAHQGIRRTGAKTYCCPLCEERFSRSGDLREHAQLQHPGAVVPVTRRGRKSAPVAPANDADEIDLEEFVLDYEESVEGTDEPVAHSD